MKLYSTVASRLEAFTQMIGDLRSRRVPALCVGLSAIHKAHFLYAAAVELEEPVLVITQDETSAARLVMDINSMAYLVSPRLVASLLAFPLLTAIFDAIGIIGGYLTGVLMLHINEGAYLYRIASSVTMNDVAGGFIKSLVFGLLVATVCCHQGYTTHMRRDSVGPEAVGNATTSAVVISCVLILVADYVLTSFLL